MCWGGGGAVLRVGVELWSYCSQVQPVAPCCIHSLVSVDGHRVQPESLPRGCGSSGVATDGWQHAVVVCWHVGGERCWDIGLSCTTEGMCGGGVHPAGEC